MGVVLFDRSAYADAEDWRDTYEEMRAELGAPRRRASSAALRRFRDEVMASDLESLAWDIDSKSAGRPLVFRSEGSRAFSLAGDAEDMLAQACGGVPDKVEVAGGELYVTSGAEAIHVRALPDAALDGAPVDWGRATADALFSELSLPLDLSDPAPIPPARGEGVRASRGSRGLDEVAARLRETGLEEWEVAEELSLMRESLEQVELNTRLLRETGAFQAPLEPGARDAPSWAPAPAERQERAELVPISGLGRPSPGREAPAAAHRAAEPRRARREVASRA